VKSHAGCPTGEWYWTDNSVDFGTFYMKRNVWQYVPPETSQREGQPLRNCQLLKNSVGVDRSVRHVGFLGVTSVLNEKVRIF